MTTALSTAPSAYGLKGPSAAITVDNATPQGATYLRGNTVQTNGTSSDRFLDGCLNDEERILTVSDIGGKVKATIRLSYAESAWQVSDLRGFANSPASDDLAELSREVAKIYAERWHKEAFLPEAAQNGDQIHSG